MCILEWWGGKGKGGWEEISFVTEQRDKQCIYKRLRTINKLQQSKSLFSESKSFLLTSLLFRNYLRKWGEGTIKCNNVNQFSSCYQHH